MAAVHTFDEFVKFLVDNKVPHKMDAERQLLELPSKSAPPLVGNLWIKWEKAVPFFQVFHFMMDVPTERLAAVETAMARLNNRLEVGGFGLDHEHNKLYCRLTIPVLPPDGINPMTVNTIGHGVVRNAVEFIDAFKEVVGGKPGDQIIPIYEAIVAKRKAQTSGAQA